MPARWIHYSWWPLFPPPLLFSLVRQKLRGERKQSKRDRDTCPLTSLHVKFTPCRVGSGSLNLDLVCGLWACRNECWAMCTTTHPLCVSSWHSIDSQKRVINALEWTHWLRKCQFRPCFKCSKKCGGHLQIKQQPFTTGKKVSHTFHKPWRGQGLGSLQTL